MNYTRYTTEELINIRKSLEGNLLNTGNNNGIEGKIHIINGVIEMRENEALSNLEDTLAVDIESDNKADDFNFDYQCAKKFISKYHDSKKRNLSFDLSLEKFKKLMETKRCYYTGIRLSDTVETTPLQNYRTFDRVDHHQGYTDSNTVVCTNKINRLKNMLFEAPNSRSSLTVKQLQLFLNKLK